MKGHRYKKKGWFGEPHRHYLAAKGIKTSRNKFNHNFKRFLQEKEKGPDQPLMRDLGPIRPAEEQLVMMFINDLPEDERQRAFEVRDRLEEVRNRIKELRPAQSTGDLSNRRRELVRLLIGDDEEANETYKRLRNSGMSILDAAKSLDVDNPDSEKIISELEDIDERFELRKGPLGEELRQLSRERRELIDEWSRLSGKGGRKEEDFAALTDSQKINMLSKSGFSDEEAKDIVESGDFGMVKQRLGITGRLRPIEKIVIERRPELVARLIKSQEKRLEKDSQIQERKLERAKRTKEEAMSVLEEALREGEVSFSEFKELRKKIAEQTGEADLTTTPEFKEVRTKFGPSLRQEQRPAIESAIENEVRSIRSVARLKGVDANQLDEKYLRRLFNMSSKSKEEIRELLRKDEAEPKRFFAKKKYFTKKDEYHPKSLDDLSPMEKMFGAGFIGTVNRIDKVQKSKLGGFRVDPETGKVTER